MHIGVGMLKLQRMTQWDVFLRHRVPRYSLSHLTDSVVVRQQKVGHVPRGRRSFATKSHVCLPFTQNYRPKLNNERARKDGNKTTDRTENSQHTFTVTDGDCTESRNWKYNLLLTNL